MSTGPAGAPVTVSAAPASRERNGLTGAGPGEGDGAGVGGADIVALKRNSLTVHAPNFFSSQPVKPEAGVAGTQAYR